MPAFIIKRLPVRLTYDNNYFGNSYGLLKKDIPNYNYVNNRNKKYEKYIQSLNEKLIKNQEEILTLLRKEDNNGRKIA